MSQTISVSDAAYANLLSQARAQGLDSVDAFVERTHAPATTLSEEELQKRQKAVAQNVALQERLSAQYGTMPDSTPLLREDRER